MKDWSVELDKMDWIRFIGVEMYLAFEFCIFVVAFPDE